eukprot:Rmarinus@m.5011
MISCRFATRLGIPIAAKRRLAVLPRAFCVRSDVLQRYWDDVSSYVSDVSERLPSLGSAAECSEPELTKLIDQAVRLRDGDWLPISVSEKIFALYGGLDQGGRERFLRYIATGLGPNPDSIEFSVHRYYDQLSSGMPSPALDRSLRKALTPLYRRVFLHMNAHPAGIAFLVRLREDVLSVLRSRRNDPEDPRKALVQLEEELKGLLQEYFSLGFLDLVRVSWNSPASILEKLAHHETVHPVSHWEDLRRRLADGDRRCYAFIHPNLRTEPLIFVQVALTPDMTTTISSILTHATLEDTPDTDSSHSTPPTPLSPQSLCGPFGSTPCPASPTTAIFYSINSTQGGLANIDLGNWLIKRVVEVLAREFPGIHTYATLSPIPGFAKYLKTKLVTERDNVFSPGGLMEAEDINTLLALYPKSGSPSEAALQLFSGDWCTDGAACDSLRPILLRSCARYLLRERRRRRALDPVANFHLRNGACVEQINWMADTSPLRIRQSLGLMVNYQYRPEEISLNNEGYVLEGNIAASDLVKSLL